MPAVLAFAVQSPSLSHDFAADDFTVILGNPQITGAASTASLFLSDWFDSGGTSSIGYYRPVTKVSFRLTYLLAGPSALAFHLGNLAIHAAAVLLLTLLLTWFFDDSIAVVGASLWGLHPMTVQAVQNVAARSDVLAAAFFLATLALAGRWARGGRGGWLVAVAFAAALAAGSKESAVLVPVAAGALVLALGCGPRRAFVAAAAAGAGVAAVLALRLAAVRVAPLANPLAALDGVRRLASVLKAVGVYAVSLLTGRPIVLLPQVPDGMLDPGVLAGLAAVIALLVVLVTTRLRSPAALGVAVLGTSLAPALAVWLLQIPMWKAEIPVAERWLYLPAAGAAVLVASVLRRLPRRTGLLAGSLLAAALALGTWLMNPAYASGDAYRDWSADIILSTPPRNPREEYVGYLVRAQRFREEAKNEDALKELEAAGRVAPWLPEQLWQRADAELALGRPAESVKLIERLLSPEFRSDPAGIRQRREMGNDSLERIPPADAWAFLARARLAAGDTAGAREAQAAANLAGRATDARLGQGAATPR